MSSVFVKELCQIRRQPSVLPEDVAVKIKRGEYITIYEFARCFGFNDSPSSPRYFRETVYPSWCELGFIPSRETMLLPNGRTRINPSLVSRLQNYFSGSGPKP